MVKADGLAAGKGVIIAEDRASAEAAIRETMVDRRFGNAGDRVVLEEFLVGQEASYFVLADGRSYVRMSSAQDHKRIFDGDRGPNTGGMGAFSPSPLVTPEIEQRVIEEVVEPVLDGMRAEGHPFRGFLYVGLMLTAAGPRVVEFNVRFGDPEAQVILPMLDEDLPELLMAAANGSLASRCRAPAERETGRCRDGLGRVPGVVGLGARHRRAGRSRGRAGRARLPRGNRGARHGCRHGGWPRAHGRGARAVVRAGDRHCVSCGGGDPVRGDAVPHRHRPEGAGGLAPDAVAVKTLA